MICCNLHCPPSEICPKKETYEMMDKIVKKGQILLTHGVSVFKLSEAMDAIQFPNDPKQYSNGI